MRPRRFRSFAKINLGLEVVGRLPGGYHSLKTLFATVSLHDTVEIEETRSRIVVHCDRQDVPNDETNLAYRAAALVQRISGRKGGVRIHITKRIAVGGGLGGGSSNAATVLRALDLMWGLKLGPSGLLEAARTLGADVPYFLVGGPVLGLGRGDDIHPLPVKVREKLLLVPGPGGVSTAAVFKRFSALDSRPRGPGIDAFLASSQTSPRPRGFPLRTLRNDLEPAAMAESPALSAFARRVRRAARLTNAHAAMSGSGSSFFLLFDDADAKRAARRALRDLGVQSGSCSFLSRREYESRFEVLPGEAAKTADTAPTRLLR